MDDKFSIASIGVRGTPVICGFNTGQHSKQIFFHLLFLKPGLILEYENINFSKYFKLFMS